MKKSNEPLVNTDITIAEDLLKEIDARARALDMTRSQYLRHLARKDLASAVDIHPRKSVKRLVNQAVHLTKKSKTFIYEQCVAVALANKTPQELRLMFGADHVESLLCKKAA